MRTNKIKITFVLPSLAAGGAERIMSFVAKNLNSNKFQATLLVIGFKKDTVYSLGNTSVIYLNKHRVAKGVRGLFSHFKKEKPHIVVSSIFHLNTIIAFISVCFPKIKFVAREANVLSVLSKHSYSKKINFPKLLIVLAYKFVDCVLCQSKDMLHDITSNYGVSIKKAVLINNPITEKIAHKLHRRDEKNPIQFITVGRLSKEKGHDRIIEVLAKLNFPFNYLMIGDGKEKDTLQNLITKKGLNNKVTHIPYTKEVSRYLLERDLFLQGSYVEGFPNALIESCVVGTPVIAFNAPGGLDEIIENGQNGYIVNSIEEYVNRLNAINKSFDFKPETVSAVVIKRFNKEKIINEYETLLLKLAST
jgi:glycosyltransferase involved in cell wall biosynthesis